MEDIWLTTTLTPTVFLFSSFTLPCNVCQSGQRAPIKFLVIYDINVMTLMTTIHADADLLNLYGGSLMITLTVENTWQIVWCVTKVWCIFWKCCFSVMECNVLHYVPSVLFEWLLNCLLCDERQVKVTYTAYQLYSLIHAFFELFFFHFFSFYLILYRSEKMFKFMIVRSMVGIRCK